MLSLSLARARVCRFADKRYGTGTLTVYNATTMQWKYIHSADMQVADYFYITK